MTQVPEAEASAASARGGCSTTRKAAIDRCVCRPDFYRGRSCPNAVAVWFQLEPAPVERIELGRVRRDPNHQFHCLRRRRRPCGSPLSAADEGWSRRRFRAFFVGIFGLGLVVSGLFNADGAYGFPVGSPAGLPAEMSWHSIVHNTAAQVSFAALIIGCFVFLRRFVARREIAMAVYTALTPVAVIASIFIPGDAGFSLRLFVGVIFLFAWLAVTSVFVSRAQPSSSETLTDVPV